MALAVTSLASSSTAGASVSSAVTASVSPAGSALLVLWVSAYNGAGTQVFTVNTVTGLGLTWTRQKLGTAGSASKADVECWTAVTGASPGSGAVTAAFTSTFAGGAAWDLDQVTGVNTTTPVVTANTIAANNSSASASATFAAAASSQNLFMSGITGLVGTGTSQTLTGSESPSWTQLANTASSTSGQNGVIVCTQVSPDVTHLTTSATLGSSGSWGVIGIEVAAASGVAHTATATLALSPGFHVSRSHGAVRTAALALTPGFTASRTRGRFRTASLPLSPGFTASRSRGHYRTASLPVAPGFSASRSHGNVRSAVLALVPGFTASRSQGHVRTAALSVVPSFHAAAHHVTSGLTVLFQAVSARLPWTAGRARNR